MSLLVLFIFRQLQRLELKLSSDITMILSLLQQQQHHHHHQQTGGALAGNLLSGQSYSVEEMQSLSQNAELDKVQQHDGTSSSTIHVSTRTLGRKLKKTTLKCIFIHYVKAGLLQLKM